MAVGPATGADAPMADADMLGQLEGGGAASEGDHAGRHDALDADEDAEDEDVAQERRRVASVLRGGDASSRPAIVIDKLRKSFRGSRGRPDKVAVRDLELAIDYGECFGLLGECRATRRLRRGAR